MTDELSVVCFCGDDRIEVSVKKSLTDQYTVDGLRQAIAPSWDPADRHKIKIYKRNTKDAATDPLTSSIVSEGKPYGSCDYEIELPSSAVSSYDTTLRGTKVEALNLIDVSSMHHLELTPTDMKFSGRDEVMGTIDRHLQEIHQNYCLKKSRNADDGKGQPIVATGATTGVGKSRLLEEVRAKYKELGYAVVVVSYNSGANLPPHSSEFNCADAGSVATSFFSRLLCMMLPTEEFESSRAGIYNRFKVEYADVLDIMVQKLAGRNVLILMDEVGTLGQVSMPDGSRSDDAMHRVISLLGQLADDLTSKLGDGKSCVAIFTALSEGIIGRAVTNSGRMIRCIPLPLLSQEDVSEIVKEAHPNADENVIHHIYAMSAGHSRTVEKFVNLEWDETKPKAHTTLEGLLTNLTNSPFGRLKESDIRAILLEDSSTGVDFQEMSQRSIVHVTKQRVVLNVTSASSSDEAETKVVTKLRVVIVPAFLYRWASDNAGLPIARHLESCLIAVWNRIFLTGDKEGTDGKAFEQFLWHYEAVRRELVKGKNMTVEDFYRFESTPEYWKSDALYSFPCITKANKIPNPSSSMYKNFDPIATCRHPNCRYEPKSANFPKYDWFTVMVGEEGNVVKGEQTKHGEGRAGKADGSVVSVKLSTLPSDSLTKWKERGWLVLGSNELERYLGSSLSFASICARHIESKRKRDVMDVGREPPTPSETHLGDSDSCATSQE